jgi:ribosomal protein L37AE/L43A
MPSAKALAAARPTCPCCHQPLRAYHPADNAWGCPNCGSTTAGPTLGGRLMIESRRVETEAPLPVPAR